MAKKKTEEIPNEKTIAAMNETDLSKFDSVEALLDDLKSDIDPLPADPAPEIVADSAEVKVYKFNADIFIFDNVSQHTRKVKYSNAEVVFENPVPVYNDSYKLIGSAVLELQGATLTGEFFIDYSTPERLNLETQEIPMYPNLDSHSEGMVVHGGVFEATKVVVNSIQLTMSPPTDERIESIR